MWKSEEKLKYANVYTDVFTNEYGLSSYSNIYQVYYGQSYRNRVVCRLDVVSTLQKYFSKAVLEKYRNVVYMIASKAITNVEQFSGCLLELCNIDKVFASQLTEMLYFKEDDKSFGDTIMQTLANEISLTENYFSSFFRGKPEFVICLSDGWLYFSVPDENRNVVLPYQVKTEVLSNAKNWKGSFTVI